MPFNNKRWLKACIPDARIVGTTMALVPIQRGYSIGIALDRYSTKDIRRVHLFCCISLNTRDHIPLLECETILQNAHVDQLDGLVPTVQSAFAEYRNQFGSLSAFAESSRAYMKQWRSMNGLLDLVQSHYLDPSIALPDFDLTEATIRQHIDVDQLFKEAYLQIVLQLIAETQSPDFEQLRATRIQTWLNRYRQKPDFFG